METPTRSELYFVAMVALGCIPGFFMVAMFPIWLFMLPILFGVTWVLKKRVIGSAWKMIMWPMGLGMVLGGFPFWAPNTVMLEGTFGSTLVAAIVQAVAPAVVFLAAGAVQEYYPAWKRCLQKVMKGSQVMT